MGTDDKEEIKLLDITLLMLLLHVFMQVFIYMKNGHFGILITCYMIRQRDSMIVRLLSHGNLTQLSLRDSCHYCYYHHHCYPGNPTDYRTVEVGSRSSQSYLL